MQEIDNLISELKNEIAHAYDTALTKQQFEDLHAQLKAKEEKMHKTLHHVYNTKEALRQELRRHEDNEAELHQTIAKLSIQKNELEAQIMQMQKQLDHIKDEKAKIHVMADEIKAILSAMQHELKQA